MDILNYIYCAHVPVCVCVCVCVWAHVRAQARVHGRVCQLIVVMQLTKQTPTTHNPTYQSITFSPTATWNQQTVLMLGQFSVIT